MNAYVVKPVSFPEFAEAVEPAGAFWLILNDRPPDPQRPQTLTE